MAAPFKYNPANLMGTSNPATTGGGFDWLSLLPAVLGTLGGFLGQGQVGFNYKPQFTAQNARSLTQSAGQQAFRNIGRQAANTKSSVASNYAARGLGSSGKIIGDIAGIDMQAAEGMGLVQAQLQQYLMQALQGIDQQALQAAMFQTQMQQGKAGGLTSGLGDLGELASLAMMFI